MHLLLVNNVKFCKLENTLTSFYMYLVILINGIKKLRKRGYKMILRHYYEMSFDVLSYIESILSVTKEVCLEKEINSKYYNIPLQEQIKLSTERNNYINMITLAQEKIEQLKIIYNDSMPIFSNYSNTPTIAADK